MESQREPEPSWLCEGPGWIILSMTWYILLEQGSDSAATLPRSHGNERLRAVFKWGPQSLLPGEYPQVLALPVQGLDSQVSSGENNSCEY